jgi:WD40 repeat protein
LYCGGNKLISKIDLVSDKIINIKLPEKSIYSAFDFNYQSNFYALGTYNKKLFLMDYKTDKCASYLYLENGVNQIKFYNNNPILFITGCRKDNYIYLWDSRMLNEPIFKFYRYNETNQKLNFAIDNKDNYIFCSSNDGTIIIYNLHTFECVSYFYTNESHETVSSVDYNSSLKYLSSSIGKRHFLDEEDEKLSDANLDNKIVKSTFESSLLLWDLNQLN